MGKMLIIKPNEEIASSVYNDYRDIQAAVEGHFDIVGITSIKDVLKCTSDEKDIEIVMYCNEEFLYDDDMQTVNAAVTTMTNSIIYGNVVLLKSDMSKGESYGFSESEEIESGKSELAYVKDLIEDFIENNELSIAAKHFRYDDNKPAPECRVFSFDELDQR